MILRSSLLLAALALSATDAFVVAPSCSSISRSSSLTFLQQSESPQSTSSSSSSSSSSTSTSSSTTDDNNPLGLTPELLKITNAFEAIGDDKLRYKQLLYMANQLAPMDPSQQIPENKVPGCLSTVFIDVEGKKDANNPSNELLIIDFRGDSDGLLTKGLVALLIRGLSGNTAAAIQQVDPAFIEKAGIAASLTPGRNNGFLNMLAVMKQKAQALQDAAAAGGAGGASRTVEKEEEEESDVTTTSDKPMYNAIVTALQTLQPQALELKDVSHQHAGHMEAGDGVESHFELYIVADAFDGLNLVKRHKLVYMMLGQVMPEIHALQITAKTPAEVA